MLMTRDEFPVMVGPHVSSITAWIRDGYKRRDSVMLASASEWSDLEASTRGKIAHDLVIGQAKLDENELRRAVPLGGYQGIEITHEARIVAYLRFRRVEWRRDEYGDLYPDIPAPLSDTADEWFGNEHLYEPWQLSLQVNDQQAEPAVRPPTNILIGHIADPITGGLLNAIAAVKLGKRLEWWDYLDSSNGGQALPPRTTSPTPPSITPVHIKPKRQERP